jgi:hypothetical protein
VDATPARTRRLLVWALLCLAVAAGAAVVAVLLPAHPSSWFAYAPLGDADAFPVPANPQVRRVGTVAIAAGGVGLLLLGAYLIERVRDRDDAANGG